MFLKEIILKKILGLDSYLGPSGYESDTIRCAKFPLVNFWQKTCQVNVLLKFMNNFVKILKNCQIQRGGKIQMIKFSNLWSQLGTLCFMQGVKTLLIWAQGVQKIIPRNFFGNRRSFFFRRAFFCHPWPILQLFWTYYVSGPA